jgi:hypothetical protein
LEPEEDVVDVGPGEVVATCGGGVFELLWLGLVEGGGADVLVVGAFVFEIDGVEVSEADDDAGVLG